MASRSFWIVFSTTLGIGIAAFLLLHFLSIALIAPVSANRALLLRVYLIAIWLLGGGLSVLWVRQVRDTRLLLPWAIGMGLLLIGALFIVVSSHDQLSLRVRRRIPRSAGKRALAFLFFNGAAGGLVWVTLLLGLTFGMSWLALRWIDTSFGYHSMSPADLDESTSVTAAVLMYLLAYSLTALFVQRRFFGRRPPRLAGVLALIIPGALAVTPNLVLFFLNRLNWSSVERVQLGNVFNLFVVRDDALRRDHLIFAAIWLSIALVLNARWFVKQVRSFEPLARPAAPPPVANATAPRLNPTA